MNSKFYYGDAVIIKENAPSSMHSGEFGSICSLSQITSKEEAEKLQSQVGDWVYTVEFENGSDLEIAECYLDKDLDILHGSELSKYSNCFIDGFVSNIKMNVNYIEIKLKSFPIQQSIYVNLPVSSDGCYSGKLILPQIEEISIHNSSLSLGFQETGTILAFEISDYALKLLIEWEPNKRTSFNIKSGQIWWDQRDEK